MINPFLIIRIIEGVIMGISIISQLIQGIAALFRPKEPAQVQVQTPTPAPETPKAEPQTNYSAYPLRTNRNTFYNFYVAVESDKVKDRLWADVVHNESAGIYRYQLFGEKGWYNITNGQLTGNGSAAK